MTSEHKHSLQETETHSSVYLPGNLITPLCNGEEAYPVMLDAIRGANHSVWLSTYHFDRDPTGIEFSDALHQAARRGADIRVIIDHFGALLHWPTIEGRLRRAGVKVVMFNPVWRGLSKRWELKTRYHRKLLVVDSRIGFTGGMNVRQAHLISIAKLRPNQDVHFLVSGPIVNTMSNTFAQDWHLAAGETLDPNPQIFSPAGSVLARAVYNHISHIGMIRTSIVQLIRSARSSLTIITPFFVPDERVAKELLAAREREVDIQLAVPLHNFRIVTWMSAKVMHALVGAGCKLYALPPPFDHSKIFLVDKETVSIGSANWDILSFGSNLEFNIECRCPAFVETIETLIAHKLRAAQTFQKL